MDYSKVFIGIPSLSRPQPIMTKTLDLVMNCGIDFKIFVEPHEAFLYKYYCGKENVVKLECKGKGIGYSRNSMRKYAISKGYKYIFELDDDIKEFARLETTDKRNALLLTIDDMITAMEEYPKLAGIRFTQYRFWLYSKKNMSKWTHINAPLQGVAFMRLSAIPQMSDNITHFEDTTISLLMWQNGYFTLNYGYSGLNVLQNQGKGGCNAGDRRQSAKSSIVEIKKSLPEVFEEVSNSYFGVEMNIDYYKDKYHYTAVNCSDKELHEQLKLLGYE